MQTKNTGDQEQGATNEAPHGEGAPTPPTAQLLEIVWSSPAFTSPAPRPPAADAAPAPPPATTRYVHAFESDFLDSHVTWDENLALLELEAAPAAKPKKRAASRTASATVRLFDIYPVQQQPSTHQPELAFDGAPAAALPPALPEQPTFEAHPFTPAVEKAVIVDGRATGMVFFETMASRPALPKNVVYYTTEYLPEPAAETLTSGPPPLPGADVELETDSGSDVPTIPAAPVVPPPDLQAIINRARPEVAAVESAVKAFFDFPDNVPPAPSEDTDELYIQSAAAPRRKTFGRRLINAISWCMLIGFFMFVAVGLLYGRYAHKRLYQGTSDSGRVVDFVVQPGESFRSVLDKMKRQELLGRYMGISDFYLMRYLAHLNENSNKIKPGAYRLSSNLSLNDMYSRLIEGSKDFKITIPEGKTAREVAAEVKRRYPEFDDVRFIELVNDGEFIKKLGMDVPSLEGYLYPSTYFFGPGMREEDLVRLMVNTFKQTTDAELKDIPKSDDLSFHQHIIMASLIEREARMDEDRPLIASVIFNRLKKDMPLQIDASVNYALNDWRRLSLEDLKIDSPYNTYKRKGLPPGPIASPRVASIAATFKAPQTDYLFYVYQGDGRHAFSATYEEFLANKHQYQKGLAETSNFNVPVEGETTPTKVAAKVAAAPSPTPAKRSKK